MTKVYGIVCPYCGSKNTETDDKGYFLRCRDCGGEATEQK